MPLTQPGPNVGRVSGSGHVDETLLVGTLVTNDHHRLPTRQTA